MPKLTRSIATIEPNFDGKEKLRTAMQEEQAQLDEVAQRFMNLAVKMSAYQSGVDPAPTNEEFEDWRESVALLRKIQERSGAAEKGQATFPNAGLH